VKYNKLVAALQKSSENAVNWTDKAGRTRTLEKKSKRASLHGISNVDAGSDASQIKRGLLRKRANPEKGYSMVDGATALALICLSRNDTQNFARVVAASPETVIPGLLDKENISFGPVFTGDVIWPMLVQSAVRLKDLSSNELRLKSLTQAVDNFLSFHNPQKKNGPYTRALSKFYEGSNYKIDALANHPDDLRACVDDLISEMCPKHAPLNFPLDMPAVQRKVSEEISAVIINVVFSGISLHLNNVKDRRKKYLDRLKISLILPMNVPIDAVKGAVPSGSGGAAAGSALTNIVQSTADKTTKKLGNIHKLGDFEATRLEYITKLYSIIEDSVAGSFNIAQRPLTAAQIRALQYPEARGPVYEADKRSGEGTIASIVVGFKEELKNQTASNEIQPNFLRMIYEARISSGKFLAEKIRGYVSNNPLTPRQDGTVVSSSNSGS
jgi:hypothetical protein